MYIEFVNILFFPVKYQFYLICLKMSSLKSEFNEKEDNKSEFSESDGEDEISNDDLLKEVEELFGESFFYRKLLFCIADVM